MATLGLRSYSSHPTPGYRQQLQTQPPPLQPQHQPQPSPTPSPSSSEFSIALSDNDGVRGWDVHRVSEWLRAINAGQYIDLFLQHDITGDCLMDLDQSMLQEIGVKRVGDRVRINAQAKKFRYMEFQRKRESVRASVDGQTLSGAAAASPRRRDKDRLATRSRENSRPASPMHDDRRQRSTAYSPREMAQREGSTTYSNPPQSSRFPLSQPRDRYVNEHSRAASLNIDTKVANGMPPDKAWIRAIYDNARSSVFSVEGCKSADEIILKTLKKGHLNEAHVKSYCFWVLDGTDPKSAHCRRLAETELLRISLDPSRKARERLMFRKIHAGEPEGSQLHTAASIAQSQQQFATSLTAGTGSKSQAKLTKLTGEPLPSLSYPMSPASVAERERYLQATVEGMESDDGVHLRPRPRKNPELRGERPESQLVIADPKQYFPDVSEEKFEHMRRMSVRRSQRLSRATSRLSIASNISFTSSIDDAPPLPNIAESAWFNSHQNRLSIARPLSVYRDSYASSMLDPLDEESPMEPDRKSYISLDDENIHDPSSATIQITDADGNTIQKSSFSGSGSGSHITETEGSLNEQLSQAIREDGEEPDEELNSFLASDAWENIPYIRGKLIGQGSFGSVYLALHATTAELMAVKQVELPSTEGTAIDAKKNNMVEALKREIGLLRDLKHKHIVHYLGSSSEANTLNIFLEYVPGGSIAKMLVDYGKLNEEIVTTFVRQVLIGLAYLHSRDIIHRDIKGANILVDSHGMVKISDFGISKRVQDSKAALSETGPGGTRRGRGIAANRVSLQGSVFWMAPEVVKQTAYTRKADIWSLGCLIVEMLTGSHPHPDLSQLQAIFKIGGKGADPAPTIPDTASAMAKEFLKRTFLIDHEQRPEAQELLGMNFVATR